MSISSYKPYLRELLQAAATSWQNFQQMKQNIQERPVPATPTSAKAANDQMILLPGNCLPK